MSAISITFTPGKIFAAGERITYDQLNLLVGGMAIQLQGQLGTAQLEDQSVTTPILALQAVGPQQCITAGFTPDSTGTAPFAPGFLSALYAAQAATPVTGRVGVLVKNNAATPNTKADIAAAQLALGDGAGNYYLATAAAVTVDITAAGASNGLDTLPGTGAAASTWYYLYVIANATTNAVQGIISTNASAPTLPSGFTFYQLVGMVFNSSGSAFLKFVVRDRHVFLPAIQLASAAAMTGYASFASFITGLAGAVPPPATRVQGNFAVTAGTLEVAADANGTGADGFVLRTNFSYDVPLTTSQTLFLKASNTAAGANITVTGYDF